MLYGLWFVGVFGAEVVIHNVILMIRFSFELQLQDGRHLENICRFDLWYIVIGASLILTRISFKWINKSNDDDTVSSSDSTITIIATTKVWKY